MMMFPGISFFVNRMTMSLVPDSLFAWLRCCVSQRKIPRLHPPVRMSDKILFLQMYDKHPLRRVFADKLAARKFIEKTKYKSNLPELYGEYSSFREIDFSKLPDRFVVKGNHGCGYVFLVPDAKKLDKVALEEACERWLSQDYYYFRREWYYKELPRRLMIEEYIEGSDGCAPWDFKIFVANSKPIGIAVDANRFSGHKRAVYDIHWNKLPLVYMETPLEQDVDRPAMLDEMLAAAVDLCGGLSFVRVDFFVTPTKFYIGEITNLPGGGNMEIKPDMWDFKMGEWFGPCEVSKESASI